jgi:hypothetical protein
MKLDPFWSAEDYKTLSYESSYFRDSVQLNAWKDAGHNIEQTLIQISQLNEYSDVHFKILSYFPNIKFTGLCFHKLTPGNYLPTHIDRYDYFMQKNNITDVDKIMRYVVFLEDWNDGQFLTVADKVYTQWTAGDVIGWSGSTPHSAVNLGMRDRYTLQVTGVIE